MADGKIVVTVDADAKKAQKELDTLSAKIDKMEAKRGYRNAERA